MQKMIGIYLPGCAWNIGFGWKPVHATTSIGGAIFIKIVAQVERRWKRSWSPEQFALWLVAAT